MVIDNAKDVDRGACEGDVQTVSSVSSEKIPGSLLPRKATSEGR